MKSYPPNIHFTAEDHRQLEAYTMAFAENELANTGKVESMKQIFSERYGIIIQDAIRRATKTLTRIDAPKPAPATMADIADMQDGTIPPVVTSDGKTFQPIATDDFSPVTGNE